MTYEVPRAKNGRYVGPDPQAPRRDLLARLKWAHGCDPLVWMRGAGWIADLKSWHGLGKRK